MKKLTQFTASILLGFGLVSCDGGSDSAKVDDKTKDTPAQTEPQGDGEATETVSLKVTGMT